MNLSKFKVKDSITVHISHPDVEDMSVELAGPSHPATLKAQRNRADALAKFRGRKPTNKEYEAIGMDSLATRILSWHGFEWDEGVPMECTPENVKAILENKNLEFIPNQLFVALNDDNGFFGV